MKKIVIYIVIIIIFVFFISSFFKVYAADTSIPNIKYIWVGTPEQMTSNELNFVANNYKMVVFNEAHVGGDQVKIAETARLLKEKDPNILIFNYFKTTVHVNTRNYSTNYLYDDNFRLKDKSGNVIEFRASAANCRAIGSYSDLSNNDYRDWAINIVTEWFSNTPFNGVAFDVARPLYPDIKPFGCNWNNNDTWKNLLGEEKIEDFNKGLNTLITDVANKFKNSLFIYNGVASEERDITQNLGLLKAGADIITDEGFCSNNKGVIHSKDELKIEINLMKTIAEMKMNKKILEKTNYPQEWRYNSITKKGKDETDKISRIGRFCYGVFLIGYQPESSFFKYGYGYSVIDGLVNSLGNSVSEITENSEEINLNLGSPIKVDYDKYMGSEYILQREFTNGYIYVNLSDTNATITFPTKLTIMNGGVKGKTYRKGKKIVVASKDALFLLIDPIINQGPTPTPTTIFGDITDEGNQPNDQVNQYDLNMLLGDSRKTGEPGWIPSDIDKNGIVNIFDYNLLVRNFNK